MKNLYAVLMAVAATAACDDRITTTCEASATIGGRLVEGNEILPGVPVPVPLKIAVVITTDVPITSVRVGDPAGHFIPAQLVNAAAGRWEASLYPSDLEHFRPTDGATATIPVDAVDLCGTSYPIGESRVALGPRPGGTFTRLAIAPAAPLDDCYVTPEGPPVRFEIKANREVAGSKVTAVATHGTWSNGQGTMELTLADGTPDATVRTNFTPTAAGVATIDAHAGGVAAGAPYRLVIAAAPTVTATTTTPLRGATAWLDFSTAGNFDHCDVEAAVQGSVTADLVRPRAATIADSIGVREPVPSCAAAERVRIAVTFGASAPDGAAVTVRCHESSYQRVASATLVVLTPAPPSAP